MAPPPGWYAPSRLCGLVRAGGVGWPPGQAPTPSGPDQVGQYMTQDPVTVPPDSPIGDLARMMTDVHIHRVIVVDAEGRPVGVVSSTDVLAALAGAAERQTAGQRW